MPAKKDFPGNERDPHAIFHWALRFAEWMRVRNYSERTVLTALSGIRSFVEWALDRDLEHAEQISKPVVDAYQRWLFHFRSADGKPMAFSSQRVRLQTLKNFFRWLTRQNVLASNPASELDMPRVERRLPRAILTEREVEKVLALADTSDVLGLRDRAIMEVLYSCGIRRHELARLDVFDVEPTRGVLTVRLGKGKKDRVVPIGDRALAWVARYLDASRPELLTPPDSSALFLSDRGDRLSLNFLTQHMRLYIDAAKLGKSGSCHIFRHSMATLMLEHGADVRLVQEILGHADMSTTALYTRVSIQHLKRVHDATHPAAKEDRTPTRESARPAELARAAPLDPELLRSLAAEAAEEEPGLAS
jgi:integrase/recombinase XerD